MGGPCTAKTKVPCARSFASRPWCLLFSGPCPGLACRHRLASLCGTDSNHPLPGSVSAENLNSCIPLWVRLFLLVACTEYSKCCIPDRAEQEVHSLTSRLSLHGRDHKKAGDTARLWHEVHQSGCWLSSAPSPLPSFFQPVNVTIWTWVVQLFAGKTESKLLLLTAITLSWPFLGLIFFLLGKSGQNFTEDRSRSHCWICFKVKWPLQLFNSLISTPALVQNCGILCYMWPVSI